MEFRIKTDKEAYNLEAYVKKIGQDLLVAIWGGERPHIGAVAKERYSFINFTVKRSFVNIPIFHLPKTHYSIIPVFQYSNCACPPSLSLRRGGRERSELSSLYKFRYIRSAESRLEN